MPVRELTQPNTPPLPTTRLPWLTGSITNGTLGGLTMVVMWFMATVATKTVSVVPSSRLWCTMVSSKPLSHLISSYHFSTFFTRNKLIGIANLSTTTESPQTTSWGSISTTSITTLIASTAVVIGIGALPSCAQTCFNTMLAQYSSLGCATPDPACWRTNVNFGFGIHYCSNGACGSAVASTLIAYGSSYCASATAAPTAK